MSLEQTLADLTKVLTRIADQGDQLLAQRGTVAPVTAAATVEPVAKETAAPAKKPKPKAEPVKEPEAPKLEVVEPEEEEEEENLDDLDPAEESEVTVTEEDIRQWRRDEGATTKDLAALKKIFADTIAAHGGVLDGKPNLPAVPKAKLPALLAALKAAVA